MVPAVAWEPVRPLRVPPPVLRRVALALLVSLVAVSVIGAVVRLTGSGLGCSTWPNCEPDSFTPRSASDGHAMVEFTNRLVNAAVGLLGVAAVVGALRRDPRRSDLVRWALATFAWIAGNGLVGALVVWLHLAPVSVIAHFVLALGAIWSGLQLYARTGDDRAPDRPRRATATPRFVAAVRALTVAAGLVLVSGTIVTGSGPHAGDERADRLDLAIDDVARAHGVSMVLFLALTLYVAHRARRGDAGPGVVRRTHELLGVIVAQGALGYWQYFAGIPAWLVGFHVLGALLVWLAVLRLWLALSEPAGAGAEEPGALPADRGAALGASAAQPAAPGRGAGAHPATT